MAVTDPATTRPPRAPRDPADPRRIPGFLLVGRIALDLGRMQSVALCG